jgi:hypothetical protein
MPANDWAHAHDVAAQWPPQMDPKPRPNHAAYIRCLRQMTPAQRLNKAFELSEFTRRLFAAGLREQFPHLDEQQFHDLLLKRLAKCHNRNY